MKECKVEEYIFKDKESFRTKVTVHDIDHVYDVNVTTQIGKNGSEQKRKYLYSFVISIEEKDNYILGINRRTSPIRKEAIYFASAYYNEQFAKDFKNFLSKITVKLNSEFSKIYNVLSMMDAFMSKIHVMQEYGILPIVVDDVLKNYTDEKELHKFIALNQMITEEEYNYAIKYYEDTLSDLDNINEDNYPYIMFPELHNLNLTEMRFIIVYYTHGVSKRIEDILLAYKIDRLLKVEHKNIRTDETIKEEYKRCTELGYFKDKLYSQMDYRDYGFYESLLEYHTKVQSLEEITIDSLYKIIKNRHKLYSFSEEDKSYINKANNIIISDIVNNDLNLIHNKDKVNYFYKLIMDKLQNKEQVPNDWLHELRINLDEYSDKGFYNYDVKRSLKFIDSYTVMYPNDLYGIIQTLKNVNKNAYATNEIPTFVYNKILNKYGVIETEKIKNDIINATQRDNNGQLYTINNNEVYYFTLENWFNLLNNIDEYKELPASWYISLIQ